MAREEGLETQQNNYNYNAPTMFCIRLVNKTVERRAINVLLA